MSAIWQIFWLLAKEINEFIICELTCLWGNGLWDIEIYCSVNFMTSNII